MDAVLGHRGFNAPRFETKRVSNFVLCDAQYLPFREVAFSEVFSVSVIAHVQNPLLVLKEMIRVSSSKITIKCPHKLGDHITLRPENRRWIKQHHINAFGRAWFVKAAEKLGYSATTEIYSRVFFPSVCFHGFHYPMA
jgi:ubiquinone/menaquinone biosynthesis C-methylase UbiE